RQRQAGKNEVILIISGIYTGYIDKKQDILFIEGMKLPLPPPTPAYRRLQLQVASLDWICVGSVQRRVRLGSRKLRHPIYQWTRKVKAKTVSVSLTRDQYQALRAAIANQRRLTRMIVAMQKLTIESIFGEKPLAADLLAPQSFTP